MQRTDGQGQIRMPNNTYKALRVLSADYDLYYSVWCSNEHELYDLTVCHALGSSPCSPYRRSWFGTDALIRLLQTDPGQLKNLYPQKSASDESSADNGEPQLNNAKIQHVIDRLDALMMVIKSCQGSSCVEPWRILHPHDDDDDNNGSAGRVKTLTDALDSRFDDFYAQQARVSYNWCDEGYLIAAEGPQEVLQYREGDEDYPVWPHWT